MKRLCPHVFFFYNISVKSEGEYCIKPTFVVYSQRRSCQWLHLYAEDCIYLSREHPQNWNLDKRKGGNVMCVCAIRGHETCHKPIIVWQVYLFEGCQRFWVTGCKTLIDLSVEEGAHSGSPGLLGSHVVASACEYDWACCFCAVVGPMGQDIPG